MANKKKTDKRLNDKLSRNSKKNSSNSAKNKGSNNNPKNKNSNLIFTYSAIEQKRHNIAGPGKCLMIFLGIFPFIPLALNLYSCFVNKLEEATYKKLLFASALMMVAVMLVRIVMWVNAIFYVYMIDDTGRLYRLRISNFWYRIKNQTYMPGSMENSSLRVMRIYYMIGNIKKVLEDISETVTYDELIEMGRLERLDNISGLKVGKKTISFKADCLIKNMENANRAVRITRMYENDSRLIRYLKNEKYDEPEKLSVIIEEIRKADVPSRKIIRFTINWTCLMVWVAVIFWGSDFSKLARINNGEYVKTVIETKEGNKEQVYMSVDDERDFFKVSDYGRLYKPVIVIYAAVEIIYIINRGTDIIIAAVKKKLNAEE